MERAECKALAVEAVPSYNLLFPIKYLYLGKAEVGAVIAFLNPSFLPELWKGREPPAASWFHVITRPNQNRIEATNVDLTAPACALPPVKTGPSHDRFRPPRPTNCWDCIPFECRTAAFRDPCGLRVWSGECKGVSAGFKWRERELIVGSFNEEAYHEVVSIACPTNVRSAQKM